MNKVGSAQKSMELVLRGVIDATDVGVLMAAESVLLRSHGV